MTATPYRATIVNHLSREIAVTADVVWAAILDEYVEATKFKDVGYTVEPFTDPASLEGSYRIKLVQDGALVDDRVCRITELDVDNYRLSIFGKSETPLDGMVVYATYRARKVPGGTRYEIDCHSSLNLDLRDGTEPEAVAPAVRDLTTSFNAALSSYLDEIKTRLEGAGG